MAGADWSSLPSELVRRVADCFLATNDVDYYMDLRAVCGNWRRATDDPKDNPTDPRFRPDRRWIIIGDSPRCYPGCGATWCCVLVNSVTGRFLNLNKGMPPLVSHNLVVQAPPTCGFLILEFTGILTLINPFTGYSVRFRAPTPLTEFTEVLSVSGSPPTLMLYDENFNLCVAGPDDESFTLYVPVEDSDYHYFIRLAALSGIYAGDLRSVPFPSALATEISQLDPYHKYPGMQRYIATGSRYLVECDEEVLLIYRDWLESLHIFKMDTAGDVLHRVESIGNHAIFLGNVTSLAVDADKFRYIEANNIYFRVRNEVYRYDLKDRKFEMIHKDQRYDFRPLSVPLFDLLRDYSTNDVMQRG